METLEGRMTRLSKDHDFSEGLPLCDFPEIKDPIFVEFLVGGYGNKAKWYAGFVCDVSMHDGESYDWEKRFVWFSWPSCYIGGFVGFPDKLHPKYEKFPHDDLLYGN